jgi:hypothetical protein
MTVRRPVAGRRPSLRAAVLAAAMVAGLGTAGCSSSSSAGPPSLTDIATVLAQHGKAVLAHDRKAFLAGLGTGTKAAEFRGRQEDAFDNLRRLPLAAWSYGAVSRTDDREVETAATKRYGTRAVVVRTSLSYALRGVDRTPTSHDLWWTFIRQHGRVVAVADNALAEAGGVSWQGPWDFGPLDVERTAHSLVLGHTDTVAAATLRAIGAAVESAVPAVSAVWGTAWSRTVAVVVPSTPAELAAQVGQTSAISTEVAAVAISDGDATLGDAPAGQRLIVNSAAFGRLSSVGRQIVVRHEITHIADAQATTEASPRWLIEGFADYVGNLGSGQSPRTAAAELGRDVRAGKLPTTLPKDAAFETSGAAAQAYEGAWLACRLIAARSGQPALVRLYKLVGASPGTADAAVAAALERVLHETTAGFTAQWRAYVRSELGR